MLEPIASARTGRVLNFLGGLAALALTLLSATVTSVGGVVPMPVLAGLLAIGFLIRSGGSVYAARRGEWGMPWGPRVASWLAWGIGAALLALAGALLSFAAFGAFVVLDALGGMVKRESKLPPVKARARRRFPWASLGVMLYMGAVAAFHFFIGQFFAYGVLVTWSLLALGFSGFMFFALRGAKATEAHLLPPASHRRHERVEARIEDPERARAETVVTAFRSRGDAGPFLELVRQAARSAGLVETDVNALESRILSSFARAGTDRDQDIRSALDEVEQLLALRRNAT